MGIFDEVGGAKETAKSGYFYPGIYLVKLTQVKHNPSGFKGESVIIEGQVLAAKSEHPAAPQPGETRAHVISGFGEPRRREMALGDLKLFTRAVYTGSGADLDTWTPQQWNQASAGIVGATLADHVFRLECFMNGAGTFTIHRWARVTAEDYAEFGIAA